MKPCGYYGLAVSALLVRVVAGQTPEFHAQTLDADIAVGYGVVVGRVDSDRWPDLVLADKSEIAWYRNPGNREDEWRRFVMARNLTQRDNVCVAARDIDGDGLVEVAVGAQWNPGETTDPSKSGAVFYLQRPTDIQQPWISHELTPHDPTVHRMHWVRWGADFQLLVLPLHGQGNKSGEGVPVDVSAYHVKLDSDGAFQGASRTTASTQMHMTHNFEVVSGAEGESLLVAGREGLVIMAANNHQVLVPALPERGSGEVRTSSVTGSDKEYVAIEPMHGSEVVLYSWDKSEENFERRVIQRGLNQGHALASADLLGLGRDQVVAGWRNPDADNKVGIRLHVPNADGTAWRTVTIDDNQMACEDLRIADLDLDQKADIVASGRATNNLVVYWNRSK